MLLQIEQDFSILFYSFKKEFFNSDSSNVFIASSLMSIKHDLQYIIKTTGFCAAFGKEVEMIYIHQETRLFLWTFCFYGCV